MSSPMPNTFVVGSGPVAIALAGGLRLGGVPVLGLWARHPDRAREAGAQAGVYAYSSAPPDVLLEATTVILAVSDDAISDVAQTLIRTGLVTPAHVFVHCSGALSAGEAFKAVRSQIGGAAVMHPLRSIADGAGTMRSLAGTIFGIEGDESGRARVRDLIGALRGQALELREEQVSAYHAAAAVVSNYLVALVDVAAELLEQAGIARDQAVPALLPLALGTLDNLRERGLPEALTGPIRRGDKETVARHLRALRESPEHTEMYRILGRRALVLSRALGDAPQAQLEAISELLSAKAS